MSGEVETGFVPLFNGKDLTGWKTHPSQPGRWKVEDGILIAEGSELCCLYTEQDDFTDVHVRAEARINEQGISGIHVRTPFGPTRPTSRPKYTGGYEAAICSPKGRGAGTQTGGIYADRVVAQVNEPLVPNGKWFTIEEIVLGNEIYVKVNGHQTAHYVDNENLYTKGRIALEVHDPETKVEFRKIEVKRLTPATPAAAAVSRDKPSEAPAAQPRKTPPAVAASPAVKSIDLLHRIRLPQSSIRGDWKHNKQGIELEQSPDEARLRIPYKPQGEYELELNMTPKGKKGVFRFVLCYDNKPFHCNLHGDKESLETHIGIFPGPRRPALVFFSPADVLLDEGRSHKIVVRVTRGHFGLSVDGTNCAGYEPGKASVDFPSDYSDMSLADPEQWPLEAGELGFGSNVPIVVHSVTLTPLEANEDAGPKRSS